MSIFDKNKLLHRAAFLVIFIFFFNLVAMKFHWYSSLWYLDMIMHTLGGFFIGLLYFLIFPFKKLNLKTIFKVLIFVFIIGLLWELFEVVFYNYLARNLFDFLDTISDLFFDLLGAVLAIFYFKKRIMLIK